MTTMRLELIVTVDVMGCSESPDAVRKALEEAANDWSDGRYSFATEQIMVGVESLSRQATHAAASTRLYALHGNAFSDDGHTALAAREADRVDRDVSVHVVSDAICVRTCADPWAVVPGLCYDACAPLSRSSLLDYLFNGLEHESSTDAAVQQLTEWGYAPDVARSILRAWATERPDLKRGVDAQQVAAEQVVAPYCRNDGTP